MKPNFIDQTPELTKVSSKGQVVIPLEVRERMKIDEGTVFAVTSTDELLVFKKITNPILTEDIELLNEIKEAWNEIERGEFTVSSKDEFLKEMAQW